MIARTWRGSATLAKADDYARHFTTAVVPNLARIAGHKGAYLLRRETDMRVEFLAVTLWDSIETIRKFSGPDPEVAHVEPEGRAALTEFDEFARNYKIVSDTISVPSA
jgi:heme-degrading monooxygenase HmoA